jgi:hypothetical protein
VLGILEVELGWKKYPEKHYESVYTRFHHSYLLPRKFGIDMRKIYFSALVRSGLMDRTEALEKLKSPPVSEKQAEEDKEYVIKKLGLTRKEFDQILSTPPKTFFDYPTYYPLFQRSRSILRFLYRAISPSTPQIFYAMDYTKK